MGVPCLDVAHHELLLRDISDDDSTHTVLDYVVADAGPMAVVVGVDIVVVLVVFSIVFFGCFYWTKSSSVESMSRGHDWCFDGSV